MADLFDSIAEQFSDTPKEAPPVDVAAYEESQKPRDYKIPKKLRTAAAPTSDFLAGIGSEVADEANLVNDLGWQALSTATVGAYDEIAGGLGALYSAATLRNPIEGFKNAQEEAELQKVLARDRLDERSPLHGTAGDLIGELSPMGVPAKVMKAFATESRAPGIVSAGKEVLKQAGLGGSMAAATSALEGGLVDDNYMIAGISGLGIDAVEGMMMGGAGQLVLGEALPFIVKYGLAGDRALAQTADYITDIGATGKLTPEQIRAKYPEMIAEDKGFVDTDFEGFGSGEALNRVADLIAQAEGIYTKKGLGNTAMSDAEAVASSVGRIKTIAEDASQQYYKAIDGALGLNKSSYASLQESMPELKALRGRYEKLADTRIPNEGGAQKLALLPTYDRVVQRTRSNMKKGSVEDLTGPAGQYLEEVNMILRGKRPHSKSGTLFTPASGEAGSLAPNEIDMSTAETNVSRLFTASKAMDKYLRPGNIMNNSTIVKENIAAALSVKKALNKELARLTAGESPALNKRFSELLDAEEMREMGADFYRGRKAEDPEFGKSLEEYRAGIGESGKQSLEAFDEGYKNAMSEGMRRHGPMTELVNLIGDNPDTEALDKFVRSKQGNIEDLDIVLGKGGAQKLIDEVLDSSARAQAAERTRAIFERKGWDPKPIDDLVRANDKLIMGAAMIPGGSSKFSIATIGALMRNFGSKGVEQTRAGYDLINKRGPDAVENLEKILTQSAKPETIPMGAVGTSAGIENQSSAQQRDKSTNFDFTEWFTQQ